MAIPNEEENPYPLQPGEEYTPYFTEEELKQYNSEPVKLPINRESILGHYGGPSNERIAQDQARSQMYRTEIAQSPQGTYWQNPFIVARWARALEQNQEKEVPDFLDKDAIGAAYNYFKEIYKDKPWYEFPTMLETTDPIRPFLASLPTPPLSVLPEWEVNTMEGPDVITLDNDTRDALLGHLPESMRLPMANMLPSKINMMDLAEIGNMIKEYGVADDGMVTPDSRKILDDYINWAESLYGAPTAMTADGEVVQPGVTPLRPWQLIAQAAVSPGGQVAIAGGIGLAQGGIIAGLFAAGIGAATQAFNPQIEAEGKALVDAPKIVEELKASGKTYDDYLKEKLAPQLAETGLSLEDYIKTKILQKQPFEDATDINVRLLMMGETTKTPATTFINFLNASAEGAERTLGTAHVLLNALAGNPEYPTVKEFFDNLSSVWGASKYFWETLAPKFEKTGQTFSQSAQSTLESFGKPYVTQTTWNAPAATKAVSGAIDQSNRVMAYIEDGMSEDDAIKKVQEEVDLENRTFEAYDLGSGTPFGVETAPEGTTFQMYAMTKIIRAIEEMQKNNIDPNIIDQTAANMAYQYFGIAGQMADVLGQSGVDPLNFVPGKYFVRKSAEASIARTLKKSIISDAEFASMASNVNLAEAMKTSPDIVSGFREWRNLVKTMSPADTIQLDGVTKFFAGLDKNGLTPLPTRFGIFDPTPEAGAREAADNLVVGMSEMAFRDEGVETFVSTMERVANLDMKDIDASMNAKVQTTVGGQIVEANMPKGFKSVEVYSLQGSIKRALPKIKTMMADYKTKVAKTARLLMTKAEAILKDPNDDRSALQRIHNATDTEIQAMAATMRKNGVNVKAERLKRTADLFFGENAMAINDAMLKTQMINAVELSIRDWVVETFGVKPNNWFIRTAQVLKNIQSTLVLGSPTYPTNNILSNVAHLAYDGLLFQNGPETADRLYQRWGYSLPGSKRGMGAADLDLSQKPEDVIGEGIANAMRGKGEKGRPDMLQVLSDVVGKANKINFFAAISQKAEVAQGKLAHSNALREFWNQQWRYGRGIPENTELMRELDNFQPGLSEKVIRMIQNGMSQKEIEASLFSQELKRPALRDMVTEAEYDLLNKFPKLKDKLEDRLSNAKDDMAIIDAFNAARKEYTETLLAKRAKDLQDEVIAAAAKIKIEGTQALVEMIQKKIPDYYQFWISHINKMGEVADAVQKMSKRQLAAYWKKARNASNMEWRAQMVEYQAAWLGAWQAMGGDAISPVGVKYLKLWQDLDSVHANFFEMMQRNYDEHWLFTENKRNTKEQISEKWHEICERNEELYLKMALDEDDLVGTIDDVFTNQFVGDFANDKASAIKWREDVRKARQQMMLAELQYRNGTIPKDALDAFGPLEKLEIGTMGKPGHEVIDVAAEIRGLNEEGPNYMLDYNKRRFSDKEMALLRKKFVRKMSDMNNGNPPGKKPPAPTPGQQPTPSTAPVQPPVVQTQPVQPAVPAHGPAPVVTQAQVPPIQPGQPPEVQAVVPPAVLPEAQPAQAPSAPVVRTPGEKRTWMLKTAHLADPELRSEPHLLAIVNKHLNNGVSMKRSEYLVKNLGDVDEQTFKDALESHMIRHADEIEAELQSVLDNAHRLENTILATERSENLARKLLNEHFKDFADGEERATQAFEAMRLLAHVKARMLGVSPAEVWNKLILTDKQIPGLKPVITALDTLFDENGVQIRLDSPKFKKFFGKSVVTDANGDPLVVYHGTFSDFRVFSKTSDIGYHFGSRDQANFRIGGEWVEQANKAGNKIEFNEGANIIPVVLRIENPLELTDFSWSPNLILQRLQQIGIVGLEGLVEAHQAYRQANIDVDVFTRKMYSESNRISLDEQLAMKKQRDLLQDEVYKKEREMMAEATATIKRNGYDGVVYYNEVEGAGKSYIAFDPEQIKSVFSKNFKKTPDIMMDRDARTDSPRFKNFFKKSKVVDKDGKPMVVYHGTRRSFTEFNLDLSGDIGAHFGTAEQAGRVSEIPFTFSDQYEPGANIMPVYLSIQNPLRMRDEFSIIGRTKTTVAKHITLEYGLNVPDAMRNQLYTYAGRMDKLRAMAGGDWELYGDAKLVNLRREHEMYNRLFWKTVEDILEHNGHDGIVYGNKAEGPGDSWVIFNRNQVKSVFNRGTWSLGESDIMMDSDAASGKWYYHQLERVLNEKMPKKASADQVRNILRGAVKEDELFWSGINEFLDENPNVTKEDVLDFVRLNQIEVVESLRGGEYPRFEQVKSGDHYAWEIPGEDISIIHNDENGDYYLWVGRSLVGEYQSLHIAEQEGQAIAGDRLNYKPVKYDRDKLVLPGTYKNYRELLLMLPKTEVEGWVVGYKDGPDMGSAYKSEAEARAAYNDLFSGRDDIEVRLGKKERSTVVDAKYRSPHWEEPDVLAHVRFDERTDSDGKRVLFIEEIQSDWHQAGRDKGYSWKVDEEADMRLRKEWQNLSDEIGRIASSDPKIKALEDKISAAEAKQRTLYYLTETTSEHRARIKKEIEGLEGRRTAMLLAMPEVQEIRSKMYDVDVERSRLFPPKNAVPQAPFSKSWDELAMKRMIRWASENGFDRVSWTTGKMQADRYNLAHYVDRIDYDGKQLSGTKDGNPVFDRFIGREELKDYVGKDAARKLLEGVDRDGIATLSGEEELSVGGQGMIGFYDEKLPAVTKKIIKKFGGEVLDTALEKTPEDAGSLFISSLDGMREVTIEEAISAHARGEGIYHEFSSNPSVYARVGMTMDNSTFARLMSRQKSGDSNKPFYAGSITKIKDNVVHSFDVTPTMKDAAMRSELSLFDEASNPRGALWWADNATAVIHAFESATPFTFVHEMLHFILPSISKKDQKVLTTWLRKEHGLLLPEDWVTRTQTDYRQANEIVAKALEFYFAKGEAPTPAVKRIFDAFKKWALELYSEITGSRIDVKMSSEVKRMFDRWIEESGYQPLDDPLNPVTPDMSNYPSPVQQKKSRIGLSNKKKAEDALKPIGEIPISEDSVNALFDQNVLHYPVADQTKDIWGNVNFRLGMELKVFKRLFGYDFVDGERMLPGRSKKQVRSIFASDFEAAIFKARDEGKIAQLLDTSKTPDELADARGLIGKDRESFISDVKDMREGYALFGSDDIKAIKKGKALLTNNGKARTSVDFILGTCQPTASCFVCYAASGLLFEPVIQKAMRNTLLMVHDPVGFGKKIAKEVSMVSRYEMPFIRLLGAGDMTSTECVSAFNTIIENADRPVHIFSRHHENLGMLSQGNKYPVIKMGSIDNTVLNEGTLTLDYFKNNMMERNINNAFLFTNIKEIPVLRELDNAGALGLIFPANARLFWALPDDLKLKACPCDAGERGFFLSCPQCFHSNAGCTMLYADKFWDIKNKKLVRMEDLPSDWDPQDYLHMTNFMNQVQPVKGRPMKAQAYFTIVKNIIKQNVKKISDDIRKFKAGKIDYIALYDMRFPGDVTYVRDRDKALVKVNEARAKKRLPPIALEDLVDTEDTLYRTREDVIMNAKIAQGNFTYGLKGMEKSGTFMLPGGPMEKPVSYIKKSDLPQAEVMVQEPVVFMDWQKSTVEDVTGGKKHESPLRPVVYDSDDPVNAPLGTADSVLPRPDNQIAWEGYLEHLDPILNNAEGKYLDPVKGAATKVLDQELPAPTMKNLRSYLGQVYSSMSDTKLQAQKYAKSRRDFALLDYNKRYGFDTILGAVFPYEFWYTRTALNWAIRALGRPGLTAAYARLKQFQDRESERMKDKKTPTRLKRKMNVGKLPFVPDWMGDTYIDPMRFIFPFEQLLRPIDQFSQTQGVLDRKTESIINEWSEDGKISEKAAAEALNSRSGTTWDLARTQADFEMNEAGYTSPFGAGMEQGELQPGVKPMVGPGKSRDVADLAFSLMSPSLPLGLAWNAMTGRKNQPLPISRTIQNMSAMLGVGGPRGVQLATDKYEDYRTDRMLAIMVGEGSIKSDDAVRAMIERKGPLFEQAQRRVTEQGLWTFWSGALGTDFFPEGEQEQRVLQNEYYEAIKNGNVDLFYDAHPEYESYKQAMKDPEERLTRFLTSLIWDAYNDMTSQEKRSTVKLLGEEFEEAFLDKNTRSYDSIGNETLATWARTLGVKTPEADGIGSKTTMGKLETDPVKKELQAYNKEKTEKFPGISNLLGIYYELPDDDKKAFERKYPEIGRYDQWNTEYMAKHPELINFLIGDQNSLKGLPTQIQTYVFQYRAARDKMFPGIFDTQDAYYAIEDTKERKEFLGKHPELSKYWEWRRTMAADFPQAAPYILSAESMAESILGDLQAKPTTPKSTGTTTKSVATGYKDTTLRYENISVPVTAVMMGEIANYLSSNKKLGEETEKYLTDAWKKNGKPGGSLDKFIRVYLKASMPPQPKSHPRILTQGELAQFSASLTRQLLSHMYAGEQLSAGALEELQHLMKTFGIKDIPIDIFIEEYIRPALK